jgi:hypothetical protein
MPAAPRFARRWSDWLSETGNSAADSPDDDDVAEAPIASLYDWATRYRRIDAGTFSLARFLPLRAIYDDEHPHICVMKPAQRGVSEYAINRALFALELGAKYFQTQKDGLNVAYLFPTQQALNDFSKERISGIKSEHQHLADLLANDEFSGVQFKKIGNSYLYMRGAWSESALLSFAADVLILDEFDRMDARAIALARRRTAASTLRHELDLSTPTLPGVGIHALYAQSDRHEYRQQCPHCGEWQLYDFHRDVRVDGEDWDIWRAWEPALLRRARVALTCPNCHAEIDDVARVSAGQWVAQEPGITSLRGYQVPTLPFPMTDLHRLVVSAVATDPSEQTEFWRSDLGIPYDAAGARVTPAMLHMLSVRLPGGELPTIGSWRDVTMGVDVGARFHYRISGTQAGQRRVRAMGTVTKYDDLTKLMQRYNVRRCVIDALPELHATREWAERFKGRVLRAFYPNMLALATTPFKVAEETLTIQINRTMAMDSVYAAIADADEEWPSVIAHNSAIVAEMTAPVRVTTKDKVGQEHAEWQHTLPDHYYHACVYDRLAHDTLQQYRLTNRMPVFASAAARGWTP